MSISIHIFLSYLLVFMSVNFACLGQDKNDKDYEFDPKTSSVIPKFAASVKLIKGKAFKVVGSEQSAVEKDQKLYMGDTISTDGSSLLKIQFVDDTIFTLGPNTTLTLEKFEFKNKKERKAIYLLEKGQLRGLFKNKAEEGDLEFRTRTASMGVRGTTLLTNFTEQDDKSFFQVGLLEGNINVHNRVQDEYYEINPGEEIVLIHGADKSVQELKNVYSKEQLEYLNARDVDPNIDFEPLLDYAKQLEELRNANKRMGRNPSSVEDESNFREGFHRRRKKSWEGALKDLNESLKKNSR